MSYPVWTTPAGSLGTIPEGEFYEIPLQATAEKPVFYKLQAGSLPPGMQIDSSGTMSGNPLTQTDLQGVAAPVSLDTVSQFAVRAYTTQNDLYNGRVVGLADRTFSISITDTNTVRWVTPAGSVGTYFDGVQVAGITLEYTGVDPSVINRITIISGALPPGLVLSSEGVISGYITPQPNAPSTTTDYNFTVKVANNRSSDVRTFSLLIYARSRMTADNTQLTADNTFVTADASPQQPPIITNPTGLIATVRSDNYFAYQFNGFDFFNNTIEFVSLSPLPPGLTLDPKTGWLYGYIPYGGLFATSYSFDIAVRQVPQTVVSSTPIDLGGPLFAEIQTVAILDWLAGQSVSITFNSTNFMVGTVLDYNLFSGEMTVDVTSVTGSGTYSEWLIDQTENNAGRYSTNTANELTISTGIKVFDVGSVIFPVGERLRLVATDSSSDLSYDVVSATDTVSGYISGYDQIGPDGEPRVAMTLEITNRTGTGVYDTWLATVLPVISSGVYNFSLLVDGPVDLDVLWLTPFSVIEREKEISNLGTINNGDISTFYVEAENPSSTLQYRLSPTNPGRLPQGLELLSTGRIAGRVSFDTFAVDGGETTFDVGLNTVSQPTTFDMVAIFTVNAYSGNQQINSEKTYSITVVRAYDQPFDNLYIQAMPPQDDRKLLSNLLLNSTVFPPDLIYRADDPYFGVARRVIYNHAFGLTAETLDDYVASLELNHYWKNLVLGTIKTARAIDNTGTVIYEVVYSEVIDNLVNNDGVSADKQVSLPFFIDVDGNRVESVYPNSLEAMRDQVIDQIGMVSKVLPQWMLSTQPDGRVLGFTPAWVIAYTNPGQSAQVAYNIETYFNNRAQLNLIDFKADRYELDNLMTKNWDREQQQWNPTPPTLTTFDTGINPPTPQFVTWGNYNADRTVFTPVAWINTPTLLGSFLTNVDFPDLVEIPVGTINFSYQTQKISGSAVYTTYAEIYKRTVDGTETLLLTSDTTEISAFNVTISQSTSAVNNAVIPLDVTDRIAVKIYAKIISGENQDITLRWDGDTGAGFEIPAGGQYFFDISVSTVSPYYQAVFVDNYVPTLPATTATRTVINTDAPVVWTNDYNGQPTIFDSGSMQFTAPVDMYEGTTDVYDKYLMFPKSNILE